MSLLTHHRRRARWVSAGQKKRQISRGIELNGPVRSSCPHLKIGIVTKFSYLPPPQECHAANFPLSAVETAPRKDKIPIGPLEILFIFVN